jgi:hypothetical protein
MLLYSELIPTKEGLLSMLVMLGVWFATRGVIGVFAFKLVKFVFKLIFMFVFILGFKLVFKFGFKPVLFVVFMFEFILGKELTCTRIFPKLPPPIFTRLGVYPALTLRSADGL